MASEPLVWAYLSLTPQVVRGAKPAIKHRRSPLCFSSPFHENFVVAQRTSAGLFQHRRTAMAPTQETSTVRVSSDVGLGCLPARPGVLRFPSLVFCFSSGRVVHISSGSLHLVSKGKPNENSPQTHHLLWRPPRCMSFGMQAFSSASAGPAVSGQSPFPVTRMGRFEF